MFFFSPLGTRQAFGCLRILVVFLKISQYIATSSNGPHTTGCAYSAWWNSPSLESSKVAAFAITGISVLAWVHSASCHRQASCVVAFVF